MLSVLSCSTYQQGHCVNVRIESVNCFYVLGKVSQHGIFSKAVQVKTCHLWDYFSFPIGHLIRIIIFMTKLGMYDIWELEVCGEMCFHQNFLASVVIFQKND